MTGGLMQLVAYGAQDAFLTCSPEITYFKAQHKKHTNFSVETMELQLSNIDFGRGANVDIMRNGDLATKMYLRVKLNAVKLALKRETDKLSVAWVRKLGHAMLKHVDITIGGSRIDRQYGSWLDIWHELTHKDDQERGYKEMIGDIAELTQLKSVNCTTEVEVLPEKTLYIPLQFWFNRHYGLALPLIALQYHEARIAFEFEDVNKLVVHSGDVNFDLKKFSIKDATLLVDYVYLDQAERMKFAQSSHEYLIEQLQYFENSISGSGSGKIITSNQELTFNHPTKELVWVLKNGAFGGDNSKAFGSLGNRFLTYTHDDCLWETKALDYAAENIARGMISFEKPTNDDVVYIQVAVKDELTKCNYKEYGFDLQMNIHVSENLQSEFDIYVILNPLVSGGKNSSNDYNLGKFIHKFDLHIECVSDEIVSYDVEIKKHKLNLNDVSIPLIDWIDYRATTVDGINKYDVSVIQPSNYGVRLDGKGNPIAEGNIKLNGQDRFTPFQGGYFNYVQPYQCHTHTPADGINVYSFALYPEQWQPSGTANLSRIDKTSLNLKIEDPLRSNKNCPQLNLIRDSKFMVFDVNYNIFRVCSGMGGVAYAN